MNKEKLNILLYASSFLPTIGGIEITTQTLARNFIKLGHNCTVVTETLSNQPENEPYPVVRQPNWQKRLKLAQNASIIHANGASMAWYPIAKLTNTPFVWTHNGYQVSCIDGLGWFEGKPAPITPKESLQFYWQKKGIFYRITLLTGNLVSTSPSRRLFIFFTHLRLLSVESMASICDTISAASA